MAISFNGIITPHKKIETIEGKSIRPTIETKDEVPVTDSRGNYEIDIVRPIRPPVINSETGNYSPPRPIDDAPPPPNDGCLLSTLGLALGETPISLSGTIQQHFNGLFSPANVIVQTDGLHRDEGAFRLSQADSQNNYIFVNTGLKLKEKCPILRAPSKELFIPNTNTIVFMSYYFVEYGEYYYIGDDNSLFRLEVQRVDMPSPPTGESLGFGKVYTRIDDSDKLKCDTQWITYGMWTRGTVGNLLTFHTSSAQNTSSLLYQLEVRDKVDTDCSSEVQFSLAYANRNGSGSYDLGGYDYLTPSKAVYGQYVNLCLDPPNSRFYIDGAFSDSVYVISAKRNRMGDRMDEGNWELNLAHLSGSYHLSTGQPVNAHTGSNIQVNNKDRYIRLIDDSRINTASLYSGGEVFRVVSGSIEDGVYNSSNPVQYGLFYPNIGTIILDSDKLDDNADFLTITGSQVSASNYNQLFTSISASAAMYTDASGDYLGFAARKMKKRYDYTYFIRVKNSDYNFSNNPTYITGSDGLIINDFRGVDSKTYITSIGLYNDRRELLGVGKVSKPLKKTSVDEAMFTVRLRYE
jgi:hypothetical protein